MGIPGDCSAKESNHRTEAVLLQAHRETAGLFGNTITLGKEKAAGKEEGQPGKGQTP